MGTGEYKLVYNAIHPHGPANQLHRRVGGVAEDKMVAVETRQEYAADTPRERWDVVDVRLLHHGGHGVFDATVLELEPRVLVPDGLEVEERTAEERLQEDEGSRMRWGLAVNTSLLGTGGKKGISYPLRRAHRGSLYEQG